MSLILNIETGTDVCSVALSADGELIALRESSSGRDHARDLGVFIDEILTAAGRRVGELDAVAVGKGPGSYTGLRIGVSMAKGLCYALGIPLISVGSLESLARVADRELQAGRLDIGDREDALLCPMIDARRMEVYTQLFDRGLHPLTEVSAEVITPESFEEVLGKGCELLIFGNGAAKCVGVLPDRGVRYIEVVPSARGLVEPAREAFEARRFEDTAYFEPFYLKDFVVTTSKKKIF